jgi:hypothetical protein
MRVAQYFEEQVVPGKTEWDERPAWLAMLENITGNSIRTFLIERLDWLAREPLVQEHIIADLHERRVALISVAEPNLFVDDPDRIVLRQIMGAIHQYRRAAGTILNAPLPQRTLIIKNLFPGEAVVFQISDLGEPVRRALATCFSVDTEALP